MSEQLDFKLIADNIRMLAARALTVLKPGQAGFGLAKARLRQPIDYMRCAEFDAAQRALQIARGMQILDASSPQWFVLELAQRFPHARFVYANILEEELAPFRHIASACALANLEFMRADLRQPAFAPHSFDRIFSLSVIEHIAPAQGGDVTALNALRALLRPAGQIILTLPFKAEGNIVYKDGAVFERDAQTRNFFAREYDATQFDALLRDTQLCARERFYISEQPSPFALDAIEWGPAKATRRAHIVLRAKRAIESKTRRSLDGWLARRYLRLSTQPRPRLVNLACYLEAE